MLALLAFVVRVLPTGALEVEADGIRGRLFIGVHGPNWSFNSQLGARMKRAAKEGVLAEGEGFEAVGFIPLPQGCKGSLKFFERARAGREKVEIEYTLEFTEDTPLWRLGLDLSVPTKFLEGRRALILGPDGDFTFPRRGGQGFGGIAFGVAIPLDESRSFVVTADVPTFLSIQDARNWGGNTYEIRFNILRRGRGLSRLALIRRMTLALVPSGEEGRMVKRIEVDRAKPFAVALESGEVMVQWGTTRVVEARVAVHGPGWAYADMRGASAQGVYDSKGRTVKGVIEIPRSGGATLEYLVRAEGTEDGAVRLRYRLRFPKGARLNSYQVSFFVPMSLCGGRRVIVKRADGVDIPIEVPIEFTGRPHLWSGKAIGVEVAPGEKQGFLIKVDKSSPLLLQDNRAWGSDVFEIRFNFLRANQGGRVEPGTEVERVFALRLGEPIQFVPDENIAPSSNQTADWFPFPLPWDDAPVDLSWLNHKPAGKHGFLTVKGGRLVFEDGTPAKFWGTCFSATACFPTHEQAEKIARRLAKFGVNIVRFHHMDAPWSRINLFDERFGDTRHFDREALDRLDYFIYCLKREGIYVYLDNLVHRKFTAKDGVEAADKLPPKASPYCLYDPKLIELQKEFCRKLWTHRNPYTGLRYCEDPAIVLTEIVNESDLFSSTPTVEPYKSRLIEMFKAWAMRRGIEAPPEVDLAVKRGPMAEFLTEVMRRYFDGMRSFLRSIGVRIPVTGTNWSIGTGVLLAMEGMDFFDSHAYHCHPSKEGRFANLPAVSQKGTICARLAFNRVHGRPFFVSEWNEPWPNEWRAELPLHMAYIAALQGWDGLTIYTYRHRIEVPEDKISGWFETYNDPALFGLFPHAALLLRRGDAKEANVKIGVVFPEKSKVLREPIPPWRVKALWPTVEVHRVEVVLPGEEPRRLDKIVKFDECPLEVGDFVKSDTGEYGRSFVKRIAWIDTPRTQAAWGFLGEAGPVDLSATRFEIETDFAVVAVSSLTNSPIRESGSLLVTAVGRVENKGQKFNVFHNRLIFGGGEPILVEPIYGRVIVKTSRRDLKCYALDRYGKRMEVPLRPVEGGVALDLNKSVKTIYWRLVAP